MRRILAVILLLAAIVRFVGIYPGFNRYHSDEPIIYGDTIDMIANKTLDPHDYYYSSLIPLLNYSAFRIFFIPLGWISYYLRHIDQLSWGLIKIPPSPLEARKLFWDEIVGFRGINAMYWSRYITASFSLGSVILTYFIGRKLFNKKVGLISALFVALNYKSVIYAHLGLPDTYSAFFLTLSLFASVNMFKNPTFRNYVFAGIASGLSFSAKYQFFSFLPLVLAHLFTSKVFTKSFFVCLFLIPLTFLVLNPFVLINFERSFSQVGYAALRYHVGTYSLNLYPYSYLLHFDYGWPLSLALILGLAISLRKYTKASLLLLSVIVPFFFVYTYYSYGGFHVRNFLNVAPLILIFPAIAIWNIFRKFNSVLLVAIILFVSFIPAKNSFVAVYYLTKPWGYTLASEWMWKNYPVNEFLAAHPFDPPGGPDVPKTEFSVGGNYSLAEHRKNGAKWVLINFDWASDDFYSWMNCRLKNTEKCWNKPLLSLRNSYKGLAAEEIIRYQVFVATKPWQIPDSNLVFAKIPVWPEHEARVIARPEDIDLITSCNNSAIRKWTEPVEVKPGYLYQVSALLLRDNKATKELRDGFLRMDFYKGMIKDSKDLGIISSISERIEKDGEWTEVGISERAPEGAEFLVVSLQSDACTDIKYQAQNIIVNESLEPVADPTLAAPYTKTKVDLDAIYPNSYGNF